MRELTIISGKGGTGKTSLTAAFASLAPKHVLCDADVDAADLHLLMAPRIREKNDFMGGGLAVISREKCIECGLCIDLCRFDAVDKSYDIDPIACEGCGVCVDLCPEGAIDFPTKTCGEWYISDTRIGPMVHARLGIAEENSGKLVTLIRQKAKTVAEAQGADLIITDGPPGIGCPVIASIGGTTAVVIVTEPTVSGLHDLRRVSDLAAHFKVPVMICINKYDLNPEQTRTIEQLARQRQLPLLGRIPFDPVFTRAMIQGKTLIETDETAQVSLAVKEIWQHIIDAPVMRQKTYN